MVCGISKLFCGTQASTNHDSHLFALIINKPGLASVSRRPRRLSDPHTQKKQKTKTNYSYNSALPKVTLRYLRYRPCRGNPLSRKWGKHSAKYSVCKGKTDIWWNLRATSPQLKANCSLAAAILCAWQTEFHSWNRFLNLSTDVNLDVT